MLLSSIMSRKKLLYSSPSLILSCVTGINAWLLNLDVKIVPAVQEERQRNKEKGEGEVESSSPANADMPVEKILEAELAVEPQTDTYIDAQVINC